MKRWCLSCPPRPHPAPVHMPSPVVQQMVQQVTQLQGSTNMLHGPPRQRSRHGTQQGHRKRQTCRLSCSQAASADSQHQASRLHAGPCCVPSPHVCGSWRALAAPGWLMCSTKPCGCRQGPVACPAHMSVASGGLCCSWVADVQLHAP